MDAATGWCAGCLRTIDEIAAWGLLDDAQKHEVWELLDARRRTPQGSALLQAGTALETQDDAPRRPEEPAA